MELIDLLDWYYIGAVNISAYGIFKIFKNFKYVTEYKNYFVLLIATLIGLIFVYADYLNRGQSDFNSAFKKLFLSYAVSVVLYDVLLKQIDKLIQKLNEK